MQVQLSRGHVASQAKRSFAFKLTFRVLSVIWVNRKTCTGNSCQEGCKGQRNFPNSFVCAVFEELKLLLSRGKCDRLKDDSFSATLW